MCAIYAKATQPAGVEPPFFGIVFIGTTSAFTSFQTVLSFL